MRVRSWVGCVAGCLLLLTLRAQTPSTPPNLGGITGSGSVELGQRVTLQTVLIGATTGFTFQWRKAGADISGATSVTYVIEAATPVDAGIYAVTVTNAAGSSASTTELIVRPAAPPAITTQPRATVAQVGQTVNFTFVASGSFPRTHQWRKDGADITGATSAILTLTNITTADAGVYSVQIANAQGSAGTQSASLTVNAATPPVIAAFTPSDGTFAQGQQAVLTVVVSGGSTPFTYVWTKNGAVVAGATTSQLVIPSASATDGGRYSVTVTNVAGTAASREALLTVTPPTPIAVSRGPDSVSVAQGQQANFSVSLSAGSSPITYQWAKNGTAIPGATTSSFNLVNVALTDAGTYSVTLTNAAGSVSPPGASLTVTPALAPTILTPPQSQTIAFNGSFNLGVGANGTAPLTYQWRKDGTPISGANSSSYFVSGATSAHNGVYSVVITNAAGTITSNGATITVTPAAAPIITQQPVSTEVPTGRSFNFAVSVNSTGTGTLQYQWLKNGVPIPGAISISYNFAAVRDTDAGDYSVIVTSAGGSVTSTTARLTILPPAPPSVRSWSTGQFATVGGSASFSANFVDGIGPFTYQWSKNGVPIAGATRETLAFPSVTAGDFGTYSVTITNDGGILTSPGMRLRPTPPSPFATNATPTPWLDAAQSGNVVYFLATLPARIERYDLSSEAWLPTVLLGESQVPTAFLPTPEGVYLAYGRALVRRTLALTNETSIANSTANITHLFVFGDFLYLNAMLPLSSTSGGYTTIHRTNLQPGPASTVLRFGLNAVYRQVAVATSLRKAFARSTTYTPADLETFTFGADGSISAISDSPYHGTMPVAARAFVLPGDELVADDGGTIYRTSDLTYAGSFGEAFTDLAFLGSGTPVVLRANQLSTVRTDSFLETGRVTLAQSGLRIFTWNENVFVFGTAASGGAFSVSKAFAGDFSLPAAPSPTTTPSGRYSVDDAFVGPDNVVYIFSRTLNGLVRWNPSTRSFLSTQPFRSTPFLVYHQPGNARLLVYYADGTVTEFPLRDNAVERPIFNLGHAVRALVDLGSFTTVNISDAQSSGDNRIIVGGGSARFISTNLYNALGLAWQPTTRRLYSIPAFNQTVQYEVVSNTGTIEKANNNNNLPAANGVVTPPIRFNPEGNLFATMNGRVFNADLAQVGVLANTISDAAWLPAGLYTVRSLAGQSQVQQWARGTYLSVGSVTVRGTPVRLLRMSDTQLLVVANVQGFIALTLVNSDLTVPTPPSVGQLAGVYFGRPGTSGGNGDVALHVRDNGTATLLLHAGTTRTALLATNAVINADGSFIINATDLVTGASRTVVGTLEAGGAISASVPSLNLEFTGSRVSGPGPAGYYRAPAVNGPAGHAYAILAPDGRSLVVAHAGTNVEGGSAMPGGGQYTIPTSSGARLTFTIEPDTGRMGGTADRDAFANTTFSGLRDDVPRTDRLGNISTRGRAGTGDEAMIAGFVITGTQPRAVMIRAIGPALTNFGVAGAMADPKLTLFRGGSQLAESDNWSGEGNAATIISTSQRLGAFALPAPGRDAVILSMLEPGGYTAQVSAAAGTGGVSLVEVYDAGTQTDTTAPRLINIATRGRVGVGEDMLIAGIIVTGNAPKRLLVRAIGAALAGFGVGGTLADPVLTVLSGTRTLAVNDDWGNASAGTTAFEVGTAAASVGAFALQANSRDAALLLTLSPGNYTAQVSGKANGTGVALVEVYEVAP